MFMVLTYVFMTLAILSFIALLGSIIFDFEPSTIILIAAVFVVSLGLCITFGVIDEAKSVKQNYTISATVTHAEITKSGRCGDYTEYVVSYVDADGGSGTLTTTAQEYAQIAVGSRINVEVSVQKHTNNWTEWRFSYAGLAG